MNGNANKIAMSKALGAAFLHHQVEQLEKSVSSGGPTSGNWRERKGYGKSFQGQGRRGSNPPGGKAPQRKAPGTEFSRVTVASRERASSSDKEFDRSFSSFDSPRRTSTEDSKKKDADIIVVDGSVLIHALYQVKKWCKDGREEVLIVPLEGDQTFYTVENYGSCMI